MPEQLLHGTNVRPRAQQFRRERMSQHVARHAFLQSSGISCLLHRPIEYGVMEMPRNDRPLETSGRRTAEGKTNCQRTSREALGRLRSKLSATGA